MRTELLELGRTWTEGILNSLGSFLWIWIRSNCKIRSYEFVYNFWLKFILVNTVVVMLKTANINKYNICIFSALRFSLFHLALAYCKRESSSLFFVGFIVVVEEIYTSVACDIGDIFWTYNLCFLQLAWIAGCCFSCTTIRKLFSNFL